MPIFADSTELTEASKLPITFKSSITQCPRLEEFTGCDILISPVNKPLACNESLPSQLTLRMHLEHGVMVQRKSGGDFLSSIPHLKEIQLRMMEAQRNLLGYTVGSLCWLLVTRLDVRDGYGYSNGRRSDCTAEQISGALRWWQFRGGHVQVLGSDEEIPGFCSEMMTYATRFVQEPVRVIHDEQSAQTLIGEPKNWLTTGRAFPQGIGREKREEIARAICPECKLPDHPPSLATVLAAVTDRSQKVPGIGKTLTESTRQWVGIKQYQRFVPHNWETVSVILPGDTKCPTITGKWTRLRDGSIQATYTPEELELCMAIISGDEQHG